MTAKKINRYHRKYRTGVTENMKTVSHKSPGRPATGRDPLVPVRLPRELLEAVELWAGQFDGMGRSLAIRALIVLGLASRRAEQTARDPKLELKHFTRKPDAFDKVFDKAGDGAIKQPEPSASIPARAKPLHPDQAYVKAVADRIEAMAAERRAKNQSRQG